MKNFYKFFSQNSLLIFKIWALSNLILFKKKIKSSCYHFFFSSSFFPSPTRSQNHQNSSLLFPLINIDSQSIEFPLIAGNGCYEWQSSRPEYLQIRPPSVAIDTCNSQAVLALSSNKPDDNIIWITAKLKGFFIIFC